MSGRDRERADGSLSAVAARDVIPATLDEKSLSGYLGVRLAGTSSAVGVDGGGSVLAAAARTDRVVWVDGGDEALVHLDSLTTRISGNTLVVSVDLETDQTGRAPVIVRIALGDAKDPAGLVGTTDQVAHGHPLLVSRWGSVVQAAVWSGVLSLGADFAKQSGGVAGRVAIEKGGLLLQARAPITLQRIEPA